MEKLPILLSIPHGGTTIPAELKDRIILSTEDMFDDGDAFTREIFDLKHRVSQVVTSDIARAFVDLNRDPIDLPPRNPDGVVKSHTCYGREIYKKDCAPDSKLIDTLLGKYYYPYHDRIAEILDNQQKSLKLALDCHSMAGMGPNIGPDPGQRRPLICLGNRNGQTCSPDIINHLARCFKEEFALKESDISINQPFSGGFITQTYGGNPIPWIQVEISRYLYLLPPFFKRSTMFINQDHLRRLNSKFFRVLNRLFEI